MKKQKPLVLLAQDLVDHDFETPKWLVDQIIPQGGRGLFVGEPEAGKTSLAMSLVISLINGELFLEKFPCAFARVAYIHFDSHPQMFSSRIEKVIPLLDYPDRLLTVVHNDMYPIASSDYLKNPDPWIDEVREFGADLIIFDTLRLMHMLNENEARDARFFYYCINELFGPNATKLYNHHPPKDSIDNRGRPKMQKAGGNYAWVADSHFEIWLVKRRSEIEVSFPRAKDCPDYLKTPIKCYQDPETLTLVVKPEKKTAQQLATEIALKEPEIGKTELAKRLMEDHEFGHTQAYSASRRALKE